MGYAAAMKHRMILVSAAALALLAPAFARHDGPHAPSADAPATAPTLDTALIVGSGAVRFEAIPGWCRMPEGMAIGSTHGQIVVDEAGRVFFNTDTERGTIVLGPDGAYRAAIAPEHPAIHGMQLRREGEATVIYAAHLGGRRVVKMTAEGETLWTIGVPEASRKYEDDPGAFRPTAIAVAPDGRFFVADGYGRNWIHRYDAERNWIGCFGGTGEGDGAFRTCHGMAIDERGDRPLLVVCDRENRRLQRFDLEGNFVDVPTTGLRRPCSVAMHGNLTAVAELEGRVTILGPDWKPVVHLGDNPERGQWANHGVPPEAWRDGVFTAPHAVCFDAEGNLLVMDWNASGRISMLRRLPTERGH